MIQEVTNDRDLFFRVFKRFREVNPELVPKRMTENQAHTIAVPVEEIEAKLPELKVLKK